MMQMPILELQNVFKHWFAGKTKIPILEDVSLKIFRGESVAIMGPSGAGKSTLMHVLACLTPVDAGSMKFNNLTLENAGKRCDTEILRKISFIFQDAKLIPDLTVFDNIAVPLIHRGINRKKRESSIIQVLSQVSLSERAGHFPNQLSGGETMRVAIARAIITRPQVIFADEPTGSLDSTMGEIVAKLLFSLISEQTAVVVVTHQQKLAEHADRIFSMKDGKISFTRKR